MNLGLGKTPDVISWNENKKVFEGSSNYQPLIEYVNDLGEDIDDEILQLQSFKSVLDLKNEKAIEKHIMDNLWGFDSFDGETYAKIAGFDDFSVMVLFDPKSEEIFLKHVYGSDKLAIDINDLIQLLHQVSEIKKSQS